ncbi:glycosyltransferase [Desulfocurvus sp. DL9XJH121]
MIRVLHVITGLNTGGAEAMLAKLVGAMDRAEFESHVVCLLEPGPLEVAVRAAGVPVTSLGLSRGTANPMALFRLAGILRRERPDVVQTWLYHADLLGLAASALARQGTVVWNLRCSNMDFSHSGRLTRLVVRLNARLSRLPAAVVANSSNAVAVHHDMGYWPRRFEVIPNGFDLGCFVPDPRAGAWLRAELNIPADAPLVGMAARFDPQKDHATLLHATAELLADMPSVHLALCGSGVDDENAPLRSLVDSLGLRSNVHLLGPRQDMPRVAAALDVSVLSSAYGEGFPNVVGEAMACGVPCVVTDTGDSAAVVGDTGVVVPPRDPRALAGGLLRLLGMAPDERAALGAAARRRIQERYSLAAVAARYQDLYRSLTA